MTLVSVFPVGLYVTEKDAEIIQKQVDKYNKLTDIFLGQMDKLIGDIKNNEQWKSKLKSYFTHLWIIEKMRARCLAIIDGFFFKQIRAIDRYGTQGTETRIQHLQKQHAAKSEYRKYLHENEVVIGNFLLNSSYFAEDLGVEFTPEELRNIFSIPLKDWRDCEEYLSTKDIKTILFVTKIGDEPLCWAMINAIANEMSKNKQLSEMAFEKVQEIFGPIPTCTAITDQYGNIVAMKQNKPNLKLVANEEGVTQ